MCRRRREEAGERNGNEEALIFRAWNRRVKPELVDSGLISLISADDLALTLYINCVTN